MTAASDKSLRLWLLSRERFAKTPSALALYWAVSLTADGTARIPRAPVNQNFAALGIPLESGARTFGINHAHPIPSANTKQGGCDRTLTTGAGGGPTVWRSSKVSSRAFCPQCGSTIGAIDDNPVVAWTTGVFDKPHLLPLKPACHSFKGKGPKWWHVEFGGRGQPGHVRPL